MGSENTVGSVSLDLVIENTVQELSQKVETLEQKIAELKAENQALKQ